MSHLKPGNTLLVFSTADSSKVSSWSNVPYLFTQNLESQGINVIRVTTQEALIFTYTVLFFKKILKELFGIQTSWEYSRSSLHFYLTRRKMNIACKEIKHDSVLVLNCSYSPSKNITGKLIHFCDWPYDYYISYFLNRSPDLLESATIKREHKVVKKADYLFVLFPGVCEYIKNKLKPSGTFYLGNVINTLETSSEGDLEKKQNSNNLIFIGKNHYKAGADQLIVIFKQLKLKIKNLRLDIIGMRSSDFDDLPEGVVCHGYLDKGIKNQRDKYYHLLRNAKLFINTNPKWASFSATLEALYFYTPIITSSYPEIKNTFGDITKFGRYFDGNNNSDLADLIETLIKTNEYRNLALNANAAVKMFSWERYIDSFLNTINNVSAPI